VYLDLAFDYAEYIADAAYTAGGYAWDSSSISLTPLLRLPTSDSIVGFGINGVLLFSGASELGYDAFYPKSWGSRQNP